jgi:hypothetical protein
MKLSPRLKKELKHKLLKVILVMEDNKGAKNQINIELKEDIAQGTYSNFAIITHSSSEFVIDFVRIMPGIPKANVQSRIILTPEHAKRLLLALKDNIAKFESINGPIKDIDSGGGTPIPLTFGGPTAQA